MALFYFLLVSQSFFFMSEVPVGGAWMFLLFAITLRFGEKKYSSYLLIIPFILLSFFAFTSHFTILIPTFFLWVYLLLDKEHWPYSRKQTILFTTLLITVFAAKILYTLYGAADAQYDTNNLEGIKNISISSILYSFKTSVVKMFVKRSLTMYWIAPVITVLGLISLKKRKKMLPAAWTIVSCIGYVVLVGLSFGYYDDSFLLFHVECEWMCLAILMATPFVFSFLTYGDQKIMPWLLSGVFLVRLIYICMAVPVFHQHLGVDRDILTKMQQRKINKLALYRDKQIFKEDMLDWGAPFASLMMSQLDGDVPQYTFTFIDSGNKKDQARLSTFNGAFMGWFDVAPPYINHQYFLIDSTPYQIMSYETFLKSPVKEKQ